MRIRGLAALYTNAEGRGGRPNYDVVLMIKLMVLQQWYGLSDPELERQATDWISFCHFLGYPETIPDRSTVWLFRERLATTGKDTVIWDEFQRQLEVQGLTIRRGVMQDASFITAGPGHAPGASRQRRGAAATAPGRRSRTGLISYPAVISENRDMRWCTCISFFPIDLYTFSKSIFSKR